MNVLPMKDFSIEINKHSSNTKKLRNFSANIGKLSPILMSLPLLLTHASALILTEATPFTPHAHSAKWGSEAEIKMNNCVCFLSCSTRQREKAPKRERAKLAAKNQTSETGKENRGQRILISDYIDNIISELYPLSVSFYPSYPFSLFFGCHAVIFS